jgi:hypothetical protein
MFDGKVPESATTFGVELCEKKSSVAEANGTSNIVA